MTVDDLTHKISKLYQRIEELQQRYLSDPESSAKVLAEAMNELQISLEELSSADEELIQQNNELVAAAEENRKLLNAVQEERDRLSALVNSISDEVWFADAQRKFTLKNPSAIREFDLTSGDVDVEKLASSLEVFRPDGSPRPVEDAPPLRALSGETVRSQDEIVRTPATGELRYRQVSASPVKDAMGKIIGSVSVVRDITDRKRMEAELEWIASFPNMNPNPVIEVDLEGSVRFLNPAANRLFPDLKEDGCNHPWLADWSQMKQIFRNETGTYVRDLALGDRWYQQSMYFVPDAKRIRIYGLDITERKLAEISLQEANDELEAASEELHQQNDEILRAKLALQESEEKYRTIVETGNEGIWVVDSETRTTYVNRRMAEMLGYSPEEMIGKKSSEFMDEDERARLGSMLERRRQGIKESYEFKFIRKDGSLLWTLSSVAPLQDRNGKFAGSIGMLTDITERKEAEEALQMLSRQRQLALDAARMGWWNYNPVTRIASWDERYKEIFGVAGHQSLSDEILKRLHPDDLPGVWAKVEAALDPANPQSYSAEYRINHPDGSVRWIEAHGIALFEGIGENKRAVDFVGTVADITERKKSEDELKEATDHLEMRVKERTLELERANIQMQEEIAERKKAGEALKAAGAYNRSLIEASLDPLVTIGPDGRITDVNAATEFITGDSREELIGTDFSDYFTDPDKARAGYRQVFKEGFVRDYALDIQHREGHITPVLYNASVYRNDAGEIIGVFAAARDVTEQKQAFQYARSLIESSLDPLVTINVDGKITDVNDATIKITGVSRERLIGTDFSSYFTEPEKAREGYQKVFAEGFVTDYPLTIRHRDGRLTDVLYNASVYKDIQGQVLGVFAAARDVTERKKAEIELDKYRKHLEELVRDRTNELEDANSKLLAEIVERKQAEEALQKAHDELELRIQERTAELSSAKENLEVINEELQVEISEHEKTERDLLRAKEAAEAAVEAKAAFLANMSHELRTPLNAVIGFSSLLLDDNLTEEQKENIERIRDGGEALLSIISDILEFSRAEKEKIKLELQPLSLKRCIEESLDMIAVHASEKGLRLSYTISYGAPDAIIGDPGRLRQVLANLLSNAVKFTDKGDISVSVSSKAIAGNKRRIIFAVKDTGIGMPQDKMNMLFQPFTQLEYVISRKRDGAGLGLAISKKLVELMGGEIWAESEEGRGSTFSFTIQAETVSGGKPELDRDDRAAIYTALSSQKPLSILVAEDNPSNQKVLIEMLKRLGYRADAVADGVEVLQALKMRHYDIVFMDIRMPEMDGLTATRKIRKLWPEDGPRIIAITAFALDGDNEKCLEAGMDGYIAKPVKVDDLAVLLMGIVHPNDKI